MKDKIYKLEQALLAVNNIASKEILNSFTQSTAPLELIEKLIIPAMSRIGDGWEKGTGLGLKLVEGQKGRIWFESVTENAMEDFPGGTTFFGELILN